MRFLFLVLFSGCSLFSFARQHQFTGIWEGKINVGISLRLVFEFSSDAKGHVSAILKSPDQSPTPLPTDTTYISGDSIYTSAAKFNISFSGKLINDSTIDGSFVQGMAIPLVLKKVAQAAVAKRPQTPVGPFSYNSREVEYYNADRSLKFGGTLTWPSAEPGTANIKASAYPAVLLITGSGPQDRDETIMMHKPFAVIADYLTKRGFAVLRVDDRGIGKSTGNFAAANSADFAKDAEAGVDYLKTLPETDTTKIGLIGHSEGGMIAPMVASKRKDIKFIVLLAGPGVPITQLMAEQVEAGTLGEGKSPETAKTAAKIFSKVVEINKSTTDAALRVKLATDFIEKEAVSNKKFFEAFEMNTPEDRKKYMTSMLNELNTPWFSYFINFSPEPYLEKLSCNVLALNGEKDLQVLPKSNLAGIRAALKKSNVKKYEIKELPGLNHLFQTCKACNIAEYAALEETFSPVALKIMGDWLDEQKK